MSSKTLDRLRAIALLMDDAVRVPGTNFRFGLDALIGLIPGAGDVAGGVTTAYTVLAAQRMGAPKSVLLRMVWNVVVDTVLGAVPLLGDLFDMGFKANRRNVQLIEAFAVAPRQTEKASRGFVAMVLGLLLLVVLGGITLAYLAVRAVLSLF